MTSMSNPRFNSVASDAKFIERVLDPATQTAVTVGTASSSLSAAESTSALSELRKSSLLRIQCDELVTDSSFNKRWQKKAQEYVHRITHILETLPSEVLQVDFDQIKHPPTSLGNFQYDKKKDQFSSFRVSKLTVEPMGCFAASSVASSHEFSLGFTKPSGNAGVVPTIDLKVNIPNDSFDAKDYMKGRYFIKRNALLWQVGTHLTTSIKKSIKNTDVIGTVEWRYRSGDLHTPVLLLTPPNPSDSVPSSNKSEKRKKKEKDISEEETNEEENKNDSKSKSWKPKFRVQLHFGMESVAWIPPLRLVPNRCNLGSNNESDDKKEIPATSQYYNYLLTFDAIHYSPFGTAASLGTSTTQTPSSVLDYSFPPNAAKATILAKIWCLQRGLLRTHDGFQSTEQIALLIMYLLQTKLVNARMSPLQILTSFFKLLAETDWMGEQHADSNKTNVGKKIKAENEETSKIRKSPSEAYQDLISRTDRTSRRRRVIVLPANGKTEAQTVSDAFLAKLYKKQLKDCRLTSHDPPSLLDLYSSVQWYKLNPVFLDPTMTHNYLGNISSSWMKLVQREAQKSLSCLHSTKIERPFPYLFLTEARFWSRFDAYMKIPLNMIDIPSASAASSSHNESIWRDHDARDLGVYESVTRCIVDVLGSALGDRVELIHCLSTGNGDVLSEELATIDSDTDENSAHNFAVLKKSKGGKEQMKGQKTPTGRDHIILGITLNTSTCSRVVDRGPPADDVTATAAFKKLWGNKAQIRRFKDGAIIHALVWDETVESDENKITDEAPYIRFQNDEKFLGGIVERIIRHILKLHVFAKDNNSKNEKKDQSSACQFSMREILSTIDGVLSNDKELIACRDPIGAHRMITKAFDALSEFLRQNSMPTVPVPETSDMKSRLGIPLAIDAVEPLGPALRNAEVYPPLPHPFLGSPSALSLLDTKRCSGAISSRPIEIQIRFGSSSKWPTDLRAMGAAKAAMLIGIVDGIEEMKRTNETGSDAFGDQFVVTQTYADIPYKGYIFRLIVRADAEIKLLKRLFKPSLEAISLLQVLTKRHVTTAMHHSLVNAVYTSRPGSSAVTRLATRWLASHLLSGHIPLEAVELMIARVYANYESPLDSPGSVIAGFLGFLNLLGSHDWVKEPLIVDPQNHFDGNDLVAIRKQFEVTRGPNYKNGPALYIISPNDRLDSELPSVGPKAGPLDTTSSLFKPCFTSTCPELVVLARASALAKRAYLFLRQCLKKFDNENWMGAFRESKESFRSYSALLRVDTELLVDPGSSSSTCDLHVLGNKEGVLQSAYTRSMVERAKGPRDLRQKTYRNLMNVNLGKSGKMNLLLEWNVVDEAMASMQSKLNHVALCFYNHLCPEVIALLWRPNDPRPYSTIASEFARPVTWGEWKSDTLVTWNIKDIIREISQYTDGVVLDSRVFDWRHIPSMDPPPKKKSRTIPHAGGDSARKDDDESSATTTNAAEGHDEEGSGSDPEEKDGGKDIESEEESQSSDEE